MKVVRYVANGGHLNDEDAERIGTFLEEKFGDAPRTAADVVAAARPKRSPIHDDFEWDDSIAANKHREDQARLMLRSIQVILVNGVEREPTRAFHNVALVEDDGVRNAYVPAVIVWERPELGAQVKAGAKRELALWARRYKDYTELSSLVEKVNQLLLEV